MLLTSFLIFLVLSSSFCSNNNLSYIHLNRLGFITLSIILLIFISSINVVSISDGLTLFNNNLILKLNNLPILFIILLFIICLLTYITNLSNISLYGLDAFASGRGLILIFINILGLVLLPLVNDLFTLYIIIELQSYSLYLITGLYNKSYNSTKASMLYFLTGGVASTLILIAIYLIYNQFGTTNIIEINILQNYLNYSDIILIIGLLFKMGMAPLHRWSISVYNYAPTYITAYISLVAKLSISSFVFSNYWLFNNYIILLFIYFSLLIGAYKPLYQINIKTILAYSGILNFGYILLSILSYDLSYYIYIIQYALTHLLIFMILLSAGNLVNPVSKWSPLLFINQLNFNNKYLLGSLILCMFSLIGIPPTPGFFSKLFIIESSLIDNYLFEIILLIICSVIATYYYSNIIKISVNSFLNKNNNIDNNNNIIFINSTIAYIISIITILVITFYIYLPYIIEGLMIMII